MASGARARPHVYLNPFTALATGVCRSELLGDWGRDYEGALLLYTGSFVSIHEARMLSSCDVELSQRESNLP